MRGGENPWATLRSCPDIELVVRRLPVGMNGLWEPGRITLDSRLGQVARRCVLMHELVHEERRIGWPFATPATMEKEEAQVRKITALRLVPLDQLAGLRAERDEIEPITAELVAAEFVVTTTMAMTAIRALMQRDLERDLARRARRVA